MDLSIPAIAVHPWPLVLQRVRFGFTEGPRIFALLSFAFQINRPGYCSGARWFGMVHGSIRRVTASELFSHRLKVAEFRFHPTSKCLGKLPGLQLEKL